MDVGNELAEHRETRANNRSRRTSIATTSLSSRSTWLPQTLQRCLGSWSYFLRINTRMGGLNSRVVSHAFDNGLKYSMVVGKYLCSCALQRWLMVVSGCDISHPGPGVKNRPSIASLVGSLDVNFSRYSAHVRCQEPRQEVIQDLEGMLTVSTR